MKPENKFRKWFETQFKAYMNSEYPALRVRVQKHADYATDGIPDLDVAINGMTFWLEVKLFQSCQRERMLHVTPLQRANLQAAASVGVPAGVLVGLSLGPRKGYRAALFYPPIPFSVELDEFLDIQDVVERLFTAASDASFRSFSLFRQCELVRPKSVQASYMQEPKKSVVVPLTDFAVFDSVVDRDSASEDGG